MLVNCGEDCRVKKGVVNGLVVKAKTQDSQRGCMFVLTVENSTLEVGFQGLNGAASDVLGDVGGVSGPQVSVLSQISTLMSGYGWQPVLFAPSLKASLE